MEASTSGNDFKHKPRSSYSDNSSPSRDGSASNNGIPWPERRDHGKNRDRSRDGEWNRERSFHGKSRDNIRDEETRDREQQQQPPPQQQLPPPPPQQQQQQQPPPQQPAPAQTPFPAYNYNSSENPYVQNGRQAMSMMSTYNLIAAMNSQWGMNSMDGMAMNPSNMPVNPSPTTMPMSTGMDMTQTAAAGMNPFTFMGMTGDNSNMYGMMGMGNYCQYGMMNGQENMMVGPVKDVVQLTQSVLYPPNPLAPPPTTRGKPLGCKTVFVGGLPEKTTEEIIKEVFERCGEILTIRMSKKNFCHIRFSSETFVENAMYFSGYRIKIENKDEPAYTGRLHVDYAQARDDQYEYECQQRALEREARHRKRVEQDQFRVPTPPPVVHFSEHEATLLGEKLRTEETFAQAVFILITWLERGECNKRNAGSFYSMIQSTNSHVRRLMNERSKYEDELIRAKMMLKQQMQGILRQFNEIVKVFNTSSLQKVWDHFTKAQRKNIELWKKQTEEIRSAHVEEVLNDRIEDEMDVSEDEEENAKLKKTLDTSEDEKDKYDEELNKLREENDALRCQLEGAVNENMVLRSEHEQELKFKESHIQALKQTLQSSTKEAKSQNQKHTLDETEMKEFRAFQRNRSLDKDIQDSKIDISPLDGDNLSSTSSRVFPFSESDARLIGLVSTFLHVHPFGANIDYICSYLHQIDPTIQPRDVESLMKRFPTIFREDSTGIGASLGKKWRFLGFQL